MKDEYDFSQGKRGALDPTRQEKRGSRYGSTTTSLDGFGSRLSKLAVATTRQPSIKRSATILIGSH
jgi:hypothetical protein